MRIEQQVCSLALAKRMKELGAKQESLFYWLEEKDNQPFLMNSGNTSKYGAIPSNYREDEGWNYYSAFTVAELGEMLPARITNESTRNMDRICFYLKEHKGDDKKQDVRDGFTVEYHTIYSPPLYRITADTEADARAKMYIYLAENNLLKAEAK